MGANMAIQNFLSGGYYGKLGQTIGQRWKNKRTVKAYAVPTNPRTEKQQANRGRFAYGVKLAQLAQAATYRSLLFSSESNTEWALRMSVAKNATDSGITGLDAVPLCPTGFVPKYLITNAILQNPGATSAPVLELKGTLPTVSQIFAILINNGEIEPGIENTAIMYSEFNPDTKTVILPDSLIGKIKQGMKVRIISYSQSLSISEISMSYSLDIEINALPDFVLTADKMSFTQTQTLKRLVLADVDDASATGEVNLNVIYNYGIESTGVTQLVLPLKNDASKIYVEFETPNQNDNDALSSYVTSAGELSVVSVAIQSTKYNYKVNNATIVGTDYVCSGYATLAVSQVASKSVALENSEIDWGGVNNPISTACTVLSNRLYGFKSLTPQQGVTLQGVAVDSAVGTKLQFTNDSVEQFAAFSDECKIQAFTATITRNGVTRSFKLEADTRLANSITESAIPTSEQFFDVGFQPGTGSFLFPLYGLPGQTGLVEASFIDFDVKIREVGSQNWYTCTLEDFESQGMGGQLECTFAIDDGDVFVNGDNVELRISVATGKPNAKVTINNIAKSWTWSGNAVSLTGVVEE